jgi:hypothetical protein
MAHWLDAIGSWMVNSWTGQFIACSIAFLLAPMAVILIDDWYRRSLEIRRETSIAQLEALLALPDLRNCDRQRY